MDGTLEVTSEPGRGSTFGFTASFGRARSVPAPPVNADPDLLRGRRVLVVDDNSTNRLILDEQLAAWQMQSVSVGSADEALTTLRSAAAAGDPFDIALLDLLLPDGDGLALARAIRAGSPDGQLHLLLLSSSHSVDLTAVRAAGIARCLTKPVRHSELFDSLVTAVSAPGTDEHPRARPSAQRPSSGRTVLVVEDNPVNQLVATGLLESAGYAVDIAADGVEAVDRLSGDHGYAAVLMDCRMPRLDGFDATRAVREQEPAGRRVPIIAMTASALEGEERRCLDAGMDDFLTKPVDPARLFRILRKWADGIPMDRPARDPSPDPTAQEQDMAEIVDLERMRMLDSMRRDGSSLFDRASANFTANAPGQLDAIRAAVAASSAEDLVATAHKLKGSALNLGLPLVGEAALALENLGDTGTTEGADGLLTTLAGELDRALAALARLIEDGV